VLRLAYAAACRVEEVTMLHRNADIERFASFDAALSFQCDRQGLSVGQPPVGDRLAAELLDMDDRQLAQRDVCLVASGKVFGPNAEAELRALRLADRAGQFNRAAGKIEGRKFIFGCR
jgi:hypothetical protein